MRILAHVTHEAVEKMGGIGAVLDGLITAPSYRHAVDRTVLIGPLYTREGDPDHRLGPKGRVLYSSLDRRDAGGWTAKFRAIELAFGVGIVYGHRTVEDPINGTVMDVETLLLDVSDCKPERVNAFKALLFTRFDLHPARYEHIWDFEQYLRLAEPGWYALNALLTGTETQIDVVSHEYMGMPFVLAALADDDLRVRSLYYAHETPVARKIVEEHVGHDTAFYNIMNRAAEAGKTLEEVFGPQDGFYRHALLRAAIRCDAVLAVGDPVQQELAFIDPKFDNAKVRLCYNGVPARPATLDEIYASKELLRDYAHKLVGFRPDYVFTHVTRPVLSKGLWRDTLVMRHLEPLLAAEGKTAVLFHLTTGGGTRRAADVRRMEHQYGWPAEHREGYPDLVGPEVGIHHDCQRFNRTHRQSRIVLVNQFGWNRVVCGDRMPEAMSFLDLRRGAEVEFGQSTYEPFGISPVESLCFGALCVVSDACGCVGFLRAASDGALPDNVIIGDYTVLTEPVPSLARAMKIDQVDRDRVEDRVSRYVAAEIHRRLPRTRDDMEKLLAGGAALAARMDWETVLRDYFLPALESCRGPRV